MLRALITAAFIVASAWGKIRGRASATENELKQRKRLFRTLSPVAKADLITEMLTPTNRTCSFHPGEFQHGPSGQPHKWRWAYLVQTNKWRSVLVEQQVNAFLSPYPRVVVSEQFPIFGAGNTNLVEPVTQAWGGTYGQRILAGIACVHLSLHGEFDFLAVLDDDTAVNPDKLDEVISKSGVNPSKPHLMGFGNRSLCKFGSGAHCLDEGATKVAFLARQGRLHLSSETAVVAAIGQGHLHGGQGTVLTRGAVQLLASTRPLRPRLSVDVNVASGEGPKLVECDNRFTSLIPFINGSVDRDRRARIDRARAENRCRIEETARVRALHEAYEAQYHISSHLGICSRCLICPFHGYRSKDRTVEATLAERLLGFGNCTGRGFFETPCVPGDLAIAACLAPLGVSPTVVPELFDAFVHLEQFRYDNLSFGEHARRFAQGIRPPTKREVQEMRQRAEDLELLQQVEQMNQQIIGSYQSRRRLREGGIPAWDKLTPESLNNRDGGTVEVPPEHLERIRIHRHKMLKDVKRTGGKGVRWSVQLKAREAFLASAPNENGQHQDIANVTEGFSVERTALFVSRAGFPAQAKRFHAAGIDGRSMLQLDDDGLLALGMQRPEMRQEFLALIEFILRARSREAKTRGNGEEPDRSAAAVGL